MLPSKLWMDSQPTKTSVLISYAPPSMSLISRWLFLQTSFGFSSSVRKTQCPVDIIQALTITGRIQLVQLVDRDGGGGRRVVHSKYFLNN